MLVQTGKSYGVEGRVGIVAQKPMHPAEVFRVSLGLAEM